MAASAAPVARRCRKASTSRSPNTSASLARASRSTRIDVTGGRPRGGRFHLNGIQSRGVKSHAGFMRQPVALLFVFAAIGTALTPPPYALQQAELEKLR